MGTRSTYDLEAVLAHTPWVRALAERLVGDPGEAEDIAQETWLAAERHRPSAERGLQPWLRAVVRRLALRKRRDRARLERRERAAARDEVEPSTSEIVLQDELRALVGRSLADLDEPFRSTLILRYFAGLEPSEIAAREGVPASTVRTRLRRGLEKLREDLDRRHGGRAVWGAACVDLMRRMDVSAGLVPAAVGGIAMQIGWKLTMAAAALALTAWVGWETLGADGEPAGVALDAERLGTQLDDVDRDAAPPELAPGIADAGREGLASAPVAASATAPADAARAAFAVLSGRVVDAGGRPIAGAELEPDGPGGGSGHAAHGASDPEGRFRLDVDAGKTLDDSFECSVAVRKAGFATRSVTTTVRRSAPTDLGDLALSRACAVAGRLEDEAGRPLAGTVLAGPAPLHADDPDLLRRLGPQYDASARHVPTVPAGADGAFVLADVEPGALRVWGTAPGRGWISSEPLDLAAGARRDGLVLRLPPLVRSDSIVGRVLAPGGEPVKGARIDACFQTPEFATSIAAITDGEGRFEILVQANVPHELRVTDRQDRWSPIVAAPVRSGQEGLELRFEEPREVEIRARSLAGDAVEEYVVLASQSERLVQGISFGPIESTKRGERHAEGLARLRVPRAVFDLEIVAPGFATAELGPFDPSRTPARIEFELEPLPGLAGRVVAGGPAAVDLAGTRVELHQWMGGDGSAVWKNGYRTMYGGHTDVVATTGSDGSFRLDLRKSGRYVIVAKPPPALAGTSAAAELGPLDLDVHAGASGLELRLGAGGAIEGRVLAPGGESAAGRIVALNHGDGEPFTVRTDEDGTFRAERLLPGRWQVMLATEDVLQSTSRWSSQAEEDPPDEDLLWTCRVEEGGTTRVDLDDRRSRSGRLAGRLAIEGGSAEGWIATLRDAAAMRPEAAAGSTAVLDRDGRFAVDFQRAGRHRLVLSVPGDPGATLLVAAELDLEPGDNEWQRPLALGRLAGTGFVPDPESESQLRYAARIDGIAATCRILPDATGSFTLPVAVAGAGAIERFRPLPGESWTKWKELTTFTVPANGEAQVRAP